MSPCLNESPTSKVVCNLLNIKQLPPILIKDNGSMILINVRDKYNDDWYYFNYEAIIEILVIFISACRWRYIGIFSSL